MYGGDGVFARRISEESIESIRICYCICESFVNDLRNT